MKKITKVAMVAALGCGLLFTACGGDHDKTDVKDSTSTAKSTEGQRNDVPLDTVKHDTSQTESSNVKPAGGAAEADVHPPH